MQNLYNILSPDAFLHPFIENYQALAILYGLIRNANSEHIYVDKELTTKTQKLLQEHTEGDLFALPNAVYELNETTLLEMDQSDTSDAVKVINLRKALHQKVIDEGESNPYLIPIGERAEEITEAYDNRQMTTQEALAEFRRSAEEYARAAREQAQMDLDKNTYAVYTILRNVIEDVNPEQARAVDQVFTQFPDYRWNDRSRKRIAEYPV